MNTSNSHFNTANFELWMNKNGMKWNHMNTKEQREAIKEYKKSNKQSLVRGF